MFRKSVKPGFSTQNYEVYFKASDDLPNHEVSIGSNISLYVAFSDKHTKEEAFNKLSKDGRVLFPIEDNFGMLKDKYGVQWMLVYESSAGETENT